MGAPGPGLELLNVHTDTKAFKVYGHAKKEVRVGRGRTRVTIKRHILRSESGILIFSP